MTLEQYYNQILDKYTKKEFKVKRFNKKSLPKVRSPHLEAQHFMMYEWCDDHNDTRYKDIFDYIVIPNDCDIDFTQITFEDFLKFLSNIKVKVKETKTTKKKK